MSKEESLISQIRSEIRRNGGRYATAMLIMKESPDWFTKRQFDIVKAQMQVTQRTRRYRERNPQLPKSDRNRRWSDEDILFLRQQFGRIKRKALASYLNRTGPAVSLKFWEVATKEEKEWVGVYCIHGAKGNLRK